ncbi:MAG: hypothetical protein J7K72_00255 [Candidatus Aenigmarchaeota archaeon]|nr:hypothetical protein [Candidatus Aenigmarchaeota archaeon]
MMRDSCQYKGDVEEGRIQYGNIMAASIGWQMLINWMRKLTLLTRFAIVSNDVLDT